jgi:uncharacterized membrane protein
VVDSLLLLLHVPAGIAAVVCGAAAMWADKGGPAHRGRGLAYLAALAVVSLSGVGLAITRWPDFPHLLALGVLAAALGAAGYAARRRTSPAAHLLAMSGSYVVMLTAFYVDNGPKLPFWRLLPPAALWLLPSLVAAPLVAVALRRHAVGRVREDRADRGSSYERASRGAEVPRAQDR